MEYNNLQKDIENDYKRRSLGVREAILNYFWYSVLFIAMLPVLYGIYSNFQIENYEYTFMYVFSLILLIIVAVYLKSISFKVKAIGVTTLLYLIGYMSLLKWNYWSYGYTFIAFSTVYLAVYFGYMAGYKAFAINLILCTAITFMDLYQVLPDFSFIYSQPTSPFLVKGIQLVSIFTFVLVSMSGLKSNMNSFLSNLFELKIRTEELTLTNSSLIKEIKSRKSVLKQLEEEKERYQELFEQSLDAILILNKDEIVSCNKQTLDLFDVTEMEIVGRKLFNISGIENGADYNPGKKSNVYIEHALKKGAVIFEWTFATKSKRIFYSEISLSRINIKGETHFQAIIRDITDRKETEDVLEKYRAHLEMQIEDRTKELINTNEELTVTNEKLFKINNLLIEEAEQRKKAQKELEDLNQMKDKLFSVIGHDLRNPFHNIINFSNLILYKPQIANEGKLIPYVESINMSAQSAYNLLENLLHWARSQSGTVQMSPSSIHITKFVKTSFDLLMASASKKNITLTDNTDTSHSIYADERMFETILRNLLTNALKFTKEGGNITVSSKQIAETVEIAVKDNGIGIPEDKVDKLFSPKSQFSTSGTMGESGTGLGLKLCKEFAEKNSGNIRVESELNEGTTFYITFPITQAKENNIKTA